MSKALEGLKVADFSWWVAGPLITKTLADYGATVVRIESTKRPDGLRTAMPYRDGRPGINRSGFFAFYNSNKYSMALDISQPRGQEIAKRLVAWSDVVIENFVPGVMERWGLGYEDLKKIKQDIIMLRASNQGQLGPFSKHGGLGLHLNALGGFVQLTGWPDRDPLALMFAYSDYFVPLMGLPLVCAALDYRRRTGKGQVLDMAQSEICFQFLAPYILEYHVNGTEMERRGNQHPCAAPHNAYRCQGEDRWCVIAVFNDEEWKAFCNVIGNPAWTKDPKFSTLLGRKKSEEELDKLVEEWTINHTAEEIMKLMQNAGVTAGVVQTAEEVYNDPQLNQRNMLWKMNHHEIGEFTHMGQSSVLTKTPAEPQMPSPLIGEHTEHVCKKFLGISEAEYDKLLVDGVFGL